MSLNVIEAKPPNTKSEIIQTFINVNNSPSNILIIVIKGPKVLLSSSIKSTRRIFRNAIAANGNSILN